MSDQHLINSLGRRKNWTFSSFLSFCVVFEAVPLFRENVTGLAFVDGKRGQQIENLWDHPSPLSSRETLSLMIENIDKKINNIFRI